MVKFNYKQANLLAATTIIIITTLILLFINHSKNEQVEFIKTNVVENAKQSFKDIVLTRRWNAMYGGVYVKAHGDIRPNPYLIDNQETTKSGETLVKINPAWMTRQISEIYSKDDKTSFKITSLNPLNPTNIPDKFEKEALAFFEKNLNEQYFYEKEQLLKNEKFDFMGKLLVENACLKCHAIQGYKENEIRGGIRVTIDTKAAKENFEQITSKHLVLNILVILIAIILFFIIRKLNQTIFQQEQLMINQSRHAAMGEMISMIAHQWRQPISVIAMGANNILVDLELDNNNPKELKKTADILIDQTKYLTKTIDDFRDFFKPEKGKDIVLVKDVVAESLNIIEKSLENNNITVKKSLQDQTKVTLYSRELLQVLINILKNAKEAFTQSDQANKQIKISTREDTKKIYITIEDNAGGIPKNIINKIFDPYFSTKEEKNGTGLGLYMSKTIVNKHLDGKLHVNNTEDGVQFTIELPKN